MELGTLTFYAALTGIFVGSCGFQTFDGMTLPTFPRADQLHGGSQNGIFKKDIKAINRTLSQLLKRVTELESKGSLQVRQAVKSVSGTQQNLTNEVEILASSIKGIEKRTKADILKMKQIQGKSAMNLQSLSSNIKGIEEKIKDTRQKQSESMTSFTTKLNQLESMMKSLKNAQVPEISNNLALHKPTKASSVRDYWRKDGAVDGSFSTAGWSGSCYASKVEDEVPWWQVDLQTSQVIDEVKVTARGDCCGYRLHDFAVDVYEEDPESSGSEPELCYFYYGKEAESGETISRECETRVTGRYVRITKKAKNKRSDNLMFCEVQVFGPKVSR